MLSFSIGRRGCPTVNLGSTITTMLLARLLQGFSWRLPLTVSKIELNESDGDLFLAEPLHAKAQSRLAEKIPIHAEEFVAVLGQPRTVGGRERGIEKTRTEVELWMGVTF
ncbi:hypothetical protein RHGRI_002406 [Rhododendron griersonianum]|uniref:Cytochrome P450 n=1 Tax=Rhododendron griersonianum TaxID=479676 RepID=A0AAV6LR42_9ERIC|nr:hypothetical protein RHGRI_002406 [Rhododendron griersonianum]